MNYINLDPLKAYLALDPSQRNKVELNGLNPQAVLDMDDGDGRLTFDEYRTLAEKETGKISDADFFKLGSLRDCAKKQPNVKSVEFGHLVSERYWFLIEKEV